MREQLIQYVELLFAGATDCEDIKQEILQNTLDRYDDLIAEGKVPEAAYRLAIVGIGDINEILGAAGTSAPVVRQTAYIPESHEEDTPRKRLLRAIAIGLYILCPLPLFVLSEFGMSTLGLCGLLAIVAVATVLMVLNGKKETDERRTETAAANSPQKELKKAITRIINTIGLIVYFAVSFLTGAWHITWLIFPILAAIRGLIKAILDLKEVMEHET